MSGWVSRPVALYETEALHCDFCGKLIVGRSWRCEDEGSRLSFCDPECERWWRDYWVPRYGGRRAAALPGPEVVGGIVPGPTER